MIEDDAATRELIKDTLGPQGFVVTPAIDGAQGWDLFQKQPFDAVVIDMLLPKLGGFELIPRIRKHARGNLPLIAMSAVVKSKPYKDEAVRRHQLAGYLDKPLDPQRLLETLTAAFAPKPKVVTSVKPPPVALDVPDKGELDQIPFARVLGALFAQRASGALMLRKGTVKKIVYLKDGIPVFVKSNLLAECLGKVMVAERLISNEECERSLLKKKSQPQRRQGEILVEMGSISQHNLEFALELQMQTKLFEVFGWLEGNFLFTPKNEAGVPEVPMTMGPVTLIHEGASRAMPSFRIRRDLASFAEGMPLAASNDPAFRYQALQLDPRADRLLDRIDGTRTVDDLLALGELDEGDALLVLYTLLCTSLLRLVDPFQAPRTTKSVPPPPPPEEIDLDEEDLESLGTGELNPMAELAKLAPQIEPAAAAPTLLIKDPDPPPPERPRLNVMPRTRLPLSAVKAPPPPPDDDLIDAPELAADVPTLGEGEDEVSELTPASFKPSAPEIVAKEPETVAPKRSTMLPRAQSWKREPITEDTVQLSTEIRAQVRARLEARANDIALRNQKREPLKRIKAATRAPSLDVERDRAQLEESLEAQIRALLAQDHYARLGVPHSASTEQIREAYQQLSRRHDPERVVVGAGSHRARRAAEQVFLLYTEALGTLSHPEARQNYDRELGLSRAPHSKIVAAQGAFERGLPLLNQNPAEALVAFTEAVATDPEPLYEVHRAWALFLTRPDDPSVREQVLESIAAVGSKQPQMAEVFYFAGKVLERAERKSEALVAYQRVLKLAPDHLGALEAQRSLEPPSVKKGGLLSRLTLGG